MRSHLVSQHVFFKLPPKGTGQTSFFDVQGVQKKIVDFYEVPIFSPPMQDLAQDPSIAAILALRSELVLFYVKIFFTHFFQKIPLMFFYREKI